MTVQCTFNESLWYWLAVEKASKATQMRTVFFFSFLLLGHSVIQGIMEEGPPIRSIFVLTCQSGMFHDTDLISLP